MSRPPFRPRDAYIYWNGITLRWNDNDVYGHINNAIHYFWFDSTVNAFLIGNGLLDIASSETIAYVVESSCRYARALRYPGAVEIGLALARLGTSSLAWHLGVFSDGATDAAAEGSFVQVCVDRKTERPVPVPQTWRERIAPA